MADNALHPVPPPNFPPGGLFMLSRVIDRIAI